METDYRPRCATEIHVGDGAVMTVPDPRANEDGGMEWRLRYACSTETRMEAASAIASYSYLLGPEITQSEAARRLRLMRLGLRALIPAPEPVSPPQTPAKPDH